jgi:hypothetical protein
VNNFAAGASSGYEFSSVSEKMNCTRLSNLAVVLGSGNEYSDEDESSLETLTSGYKEFASGSGLRETINPPSFSNMNESVSEQPLSLKVAAYVGIDWADEKHDVVLRSVDDPTKSEHQIIKSEINALSDWIAQMQKRFEAKGKVLVCLEQSRGALAVPSGLIGTETTKPRTSTLLPTYRMASESLITGNSSARAAIKQSNRPRIANNVRM